MWDWILPNNPTRVYELQKALGWRFNGPPPLRRPYRLFCPLPGWQPPPDNVVYLAFYGSPPEGTALEF